MQKTSKKTQKRQKRTHFMCGKMLIMIREDMLYYPRDMCDQFGLQRRTYQNYEAGKRGIPQELATRIRKQYEWDRDFMANIGNRVDLSEKAER